MYSYQIRINKKRKEEQENDGQSEPVTEDARADLYSSNEILVAHHADLNGAIFGVAKSR